MTDRPILYSAPMIRAKLAGTKTQTRRILKLPKWSTGDMKHVEFDDDGTPITICKDTGCLSAIPVRFKVGDRLWARESFATAGPVVRYAATDAIHELRKLKPSIHMPRWASRITDIVTDVRVQRLQEITEEDAAAEGIVRFARPGYRMDGYGLEDSLRDDASPTRVAAYAKLWESINGPGAWRDNPWVVAITSRVVLANIDKVPKS